MANPHVIAAHKLPPVFTGKGISSKAQRPGTARKATGWWLHLSFLGHLEKLAARLEMPLTVPCDVSHSCKKAPNRKSRHPLPLTSLGE